MDATKKRGVGRPRKFTDESKPITVTLPKQILQLLHAIDKDRARAIVKVTNAAMADMWSDSSHIELLKVEPGISLIVVGPSNYLKQIKWIKLIEIAPARYLISIPPGTLLEKLEIAILDILEDIPLDDVYERGLLENLKKRIGVLRKQDKLSKSEIIFVNA